MSLMSNAQRTVRLKTESLLKKEDGMTFEELKDQIAPNFDEELPIEGMIDHALRELYLQYKVGFAYNSRDEKEYYWEE